MSAVSHELGEPGVGSQLHGLLAEPDAVVSALNRHEAEISLKGFIPYIWPVIEPGRKLVLGWAFDAICEHLEAVSYGHIKRLLINVPPGFMKSLLTEVIWPAWEWGPHNKPHLRYVCSSYSDRLTIRDNLRCRRIIQSEIYQDAWGDRFAMTTDQNAKTKFENDRTGFKLATTVRGLGAGERGDRFCIDDPHNTLDADSEKVRDTTLEWFSNTVPTRIIEAETSAIVVIMQRLHDQDVSGLILKNELGYEWLCLPMEYEKRHRCFTSVPRDGIFPERVARFRREGEPIPRWLTPDEVDAELGEGGPPSVEWEPDYQMLYAQDRRADEGDLLCPERFSEHHLEVELKPQLRLWGGTYAEAGQLQQRPAPRGGGMMQRDDFQFVDSLPTGGRWCRGWDFAASTEKRAAWTVGLKMGIVDGRVYIGDVRRRRVTPGKLEAMILACCDSDGPNCEQDMPQDPGQSGKYQIRALARVLHGKNFHFSLESGSKPERARGFAAQVEAQNVYLLRGPWNDTFLNEACLFPNGEFSDQIDGASRSYGRLLTKRVRRTGVAPIAIGG